MHPEETALRRELAALAAHPQGRRLLQLALRGIERGEHGLTAGCWTARGAASGCLFQHAYWQGVAEGVFDAQGRANERIERLVGGGDYRLVVRAIAAFDRLGRRRFTARLRGPLGVPRRRLDEDAWRSAVAGVLVDTLDAPAGPDEPGARRTGRLRTGG